MRDAAAGTHGWRGDVRCGLGVLEKREMRGAMVEDEVGEISIYRPLRWRTRRSLRKKWRRKSVGAHRPNVFLVKLILIAHLDSISALSAVSAVNNPD